MVVVSARSSRDFPELPFAPIILMVIPSPEDSGPTVIRMAILSPPRNRTQVVETVDACRPWHLGHCIADCRPAGGRAITCACLVNPATLGHPSAQENVVAKRNYHQARKQRELARKSRQHEKQERRSARARVAEPGSQVEPSGDAASTPDTPAKGET